MSSERSKSPSPLELVGETLRHALNVLATVVPEWLKQRAKSEWFDRYGERVEDYRLPKDKTEREALSAVIGDDGYFLLDCIEQAHELAWLPQLPAIQALAQVWSQQYRREQGHARRLSPNEMPPVGEWIRSPYDLEVCYGKKRDFDRVGNKVHLTECCDDTLPHILTQIEPVRAIEQEIITPWIPSKQILAAWRPVCQNTDLAFRYACRLVGSSPTVSN